MENEDNNDETDMTDSKTIKEEKIVEKEDITTIHIMSKKVEMELIWNKILSYSKDNKQKEFLIKYCDLLSQYLKNELKDNKLEQESKNNIVLGFFKENNVIEKIINFIIIYPDNREIFLGYSSFYLNVLRFKEEIIKNNKLLKKAIFQTTIKLFEELKKYRFKFKLKNEFSLFLNMVTRILLNYPDYIKYFKVKKENIYTHIQYNEYFIFSSLLTLLEIDDTIQEFEYKKYIRRSLIVYLSFDEIINSYYFQNKITLVEILVNKLCNYYQMLPDYFDFEKTTGTLEIGCNLHFNFQSLCPKYFDYVDYISFLGKITNCLSGNIKNKFKYYFFNKFLINSIQPYILSQNIKITRTHFQYIITLLYFSKNDIIIDDIIYFLFGFRETPMERIYNLSLIFNVDEKNIANQKSINNNKIESEKEIIEYISMTDNYIYKKHKDNDIFFLIMNYLTQNKEYINVIIYELFEILFQKKPYTMIQKFVKPYVDFVIRQRKSNKYKNNNYLNKDKSYPITIQLIKLIDYYKQFDTNDMLHNFESSAFKNFAFYKNYDIDFYINYLNNKKEEENEKNNDSMLMTINSFNSYTTLFTSKDNISINNQISVDNLMNGLFEEDIKLCDNKNKVEHDFLFLDKNLFKDEMSIEEGINNMNFLFMKNLYEKLINFFKNNFIENIFLTNLLLTIISVPCLNFNSDLVQCNSIILDDDCDSKYSFLTLFRFLCQEILNKFKSISNIDKLKKFIKIIIGNGNKGERGKKNDFIFKGFLKMKYNEKNKDKIEVINFIIFCEFIKEYISSISYKHKFERIIENLYGFYVDKLEENERKNFFL
jgi:hypothetical protein